MDSGTSLDSAANSNEAGICGLPVYYSQLLTVAQSANDDNLSSHTLNSAGIMPNPNSSTEVAPGAGYSFPFQDDRATSRGQTLNPLMAGLLALPVVPNKPTDDKDAGTEEDTVMDEAKSSTSSWIDTLYNAICDSFNRIKLEFGAVFDEDGKLTPPARLSRSEKTMQHIMLYPYVRSRVSR